MNIRHCRWLVLLQCLPIILGALPCTAQDYPIVDTGQQRCYDDRFEIEYPRMGNSYSGQDAQYKGNQPSYVNNGDGTITDRVTGLMWQQDPGSKKTFEQAVDGASRCRTGGHNDWRLPTIKEVYSLIQFSGEDVDPESTSVVGLRPFIDTEYFGFKYGDPAQGERVIDSQIATSTKYVSTTMGGNQTMFGVNFADGRIKGYPIGQSGRRGGPSKLYVVFYVRGNENYGKNQFEDNADGTIIDKATGLMWAKVDSGHLRAGTNKDGKLDWEEALRWAEELEYGGHSDWRLPNIKELQSIVDYTRSPDTTNSAAIDPIFEVTTIRDGMGEVNYPFYWSSTTHKREGKGDTAAYVAFGRSQGWMRGRRGGDHQLLDVHGAGSQRSDPKSGDASKFPLGRGPQGDVIGIDNMVRPVRGGQADLQKIGPELESKAARPSRGRNEVNNSGQANRLSFVKRLDRDGDGRVSRREFDGPPVAFDRHDSNKDGYLSDNEMSKGNNFRRPQRNERSPSGQESKRRRPNGSFPQRGK